MSAARKPARTRERVVAYGKKIKSVPAKVAAGEGRKLTKVGNSYAAIIPRQVMAVLGLDADTRVTYTTDGKSLIISPVAKEGRAALVSDAIDRVFTRYRKTMLTLAGR